MAKGFNLTAQINLRGPTNLKPIVADIRRQLGTVSSDINIKLNPQTAKSISTITSRLKSMNDMLVTAKGNSDALNSSLANLSSSLSGIGNSGNKSITAITKTGAGAKNAAQNIKQATTEMEQFGKQSALAIRRFAAFTIVSGAIYKLVNAVNSGFAAFVNFDKQLVKLQQVTGKGAIGLKNLENQITNLATSLGVSSESLIEVASTLAQAGLNAEDTRIALSALAKTELAPSFDNLTDTTEGAIAALRQFELQAGDLEAALGSINAVAAAFAVESSDIITAIQRTGGVFAAASKGVSEGKDALNEFIAVFTSVRATTRESAETIATGLRTIFTRIQRGKTIEALKEYGIILTDLEGKFVGPYEAVKRLSEGLKLLDPRDLRFSQIVEELGGFRQIGKVIPLIQQFAEAQKALKVAQTGQTSLIDAQLIAQKSLANQIAKVREQFLALIRDVGKSATFQAITKIVLNLTSAFISLAGAFKPILPFLAILGTIKGVKALGEFGSGFFGGLRSSPNGVSTAKNVGNTIGSTISGNKEKEKTAATKLATDSIRANTDAIKSLTVAIVNLENTIKSRGTATLNSGGKVMAFARGGMVPGTGNRDTVPAMLQPGEFVIRKKAVDTIGAGNLHTMNKYASGGQIIKVKADKLKTKKMQEHVKSANSNIDEKEFLKGKYITNSDTISFSKKEYGLASSSNIGFKKFEENVGKKIGGKPVGGNEPVDIPINNKGFPIEVRNRNKTTKDPELLDKLLRYKLKDTGKLINNQKTKDPDPLYAGTIGVAYNTSKIKRGRFEKLNRGGYIQKFAGGGKALGARSRIKELDDSELAQLSTKDLIAYAKAQARDIFSTSGAGMATGSEFIEVPQERIIPELESSLVSYMGKRGFWREIISPFGQPIQPKIQTNNKLDRQQALEAQVSRYSDEVAAREQQWTQIRQGSDIDNYLLSKLSEPILSDYKTVRGGGSLGKQFHNTRLRKAVNEALEAYDNFDYSASNIDKLVSSFAAKKFAYGGLIQKFAEGLTVKPVGPVSEDILRRIDELGGPGPIREAVGVDFINSTIKEKLKKTISAKDLLSPRSLKSMPDSASLLPAIEPVLEQAEKIKKEKENAKRDQIARNLKASAGGAYQFGLASIFGPNGEFGYSKTSNAQEVEGKNGDKYLTQIVQKSLPTRYESVIQKLREQLMDAPQTAAESLQHADIFGTGGPLAFDFDETLVDGADIPGKKFSDYNDLEKVKDALSNSKLTLLGKELRKRLDKNPKLMDSIRVLTARPQSNAPLLAAALAKLQLPIPESKITGVSGGLNKVDNLSELETLIDDNSENIQSVLSGGKKAIQYEQAKALNLSDTSSRKSLSVMEGYALEEMVRSLGVKISDDDADPGRPIDFPRGLGSKARFWDMPSTIPTDTKRTNSSSAVSRLFKEAQRFYVEKFAFGGKAEGPTLEEISKNIKDKYPEIDFRISKRKQGRGFGYNLLGALKSDGGLLKSKGLKFEQPKNLQQLMETSDKIASQLMNPQEFALGGLADATSEMSGLMRGLYGNRSQAETPNTKKEKQFGKIALRKDGNSIAATYFKNDTRSGQVSAYKMRDYLYYVGLSQATQGYGPRLYDAVMEAATEQGAMLTSDRNSVSGAAKKVWEYYFKNRGDVKKTPLKPEDWTRNQSEIDPKLYGKPETWPPSTDPAWILQSGYSKSPSLINDPNSVIRMDKQAQNSAVTALQYFQSKPVGFAKGGSAEDTVPALLTPGEFVINKKAAQRIGYSRLHEMNRADKIQGYNKGGYVGVKRFFKGGVAEKDVERAQGTLLVDIKQAEKTFATIMGQLGKNIRKTIIDDFQGIESVKSGNKQRLLSVGGAFSEGTRGRANMRGSSTSMGLQIQGKTVSATTETVAHESGHLADYALGNKKGFASQTQDTFQFKLVEKIKPVMEKAFLKAGESAEKIANYLGSNTELFAEFFAKASPQVRAIITSTTDAEIGMKMLADHLGETGYTFAGLEASDIIDPWESVKEALNKAATDINTTASNIGDSDLPKVNSQIAKENSEYFTRKAEKVGMSASGYKYNLAQQVGEQAYNIRQDQKFAKAETKDIAIGKSRELKGLNVKSGEFKSLLGEGATSDQAKKAQAAVAEFATNLQKIAPNMKPDEIRSAAEALAEGLATGTDSVEELIAGNEQLSQIFATTISEGEALDEAFRRVAESAGISAETIKANVSPKVIEQQAFIKSKEGQRFGKLAEFAPGLAQKLSKAGGERLGKAADFISGKGGKFSKGFASLGGFQGIGSGLAVGSEIFKNSGLISKQTLKDPNVAGAFGAVQGAGAMGATGAELGGQLAGPVGALIGGIGGAVIGGIKGFFDAKNAQILSNALEKLTKSSEAVDVAFKELAKNDTDKNFKNVQKAFGQQIEAAQELENIAFGGGGEGPSVGGVGGGALAGAAGGALIGSFIPVIGTAIGAALGGIIGGGAAYLVEGQNKANREEALRNRVGSAGAMNESAARMAERQMGKMTTEQLGQQEKAGVNIIAEQYKQSAVAAAEAANGTKNLTAAQKERISQGAAETAYLDAYMKMRKEAGATDEKISEDIMTDRKLALEAGKKALDSQSQAAQKQALLARATKEVALATENLLDVYRRVGAKAQKFSDEVDDMLSGTQATIASLSGNAAVQKVDRSGSERILGNMSAYSSQEVKAATQEMVGKLGGGEEAQALGRQAEAAKFLQDKLPAMLREPGADPKKIMDSLSQELSTMGIGGDAIDKMLGEIEKQISDNEKGGLGTLADEISAGGIDKFSMTAAEAAKTLQNLSKTYNDTLQKSIDLQNQYNETIMQSNAYLRKAGTIRITAELDLAKALGNSPTLDQLNQPFDFEIQDLTKGLVPGGTTDPTAIANGILAATAQNQQLQEANANLGNVGMQGATGDAGAQLLAEQQKNIAAMGANNVAINEGRQALEKLANDGTKAANALAKIEEQQRQIEGLGNRFEKIFTAGPEELFKMNRQSDALALAQTAGAEQFQSRAFRQDAFAGLEQDKEFLSPEEYRKQRGMLMRKSLEAQGYTGQSMIQKGGINMTVDDFIKRIEGGMPSEEDPNVKAYREAIDTQIKANEELARLEEIKSLEIQEAMLGLQQFLADEFPRILTDAIKESRADGETKPEIKSEPSKGEKDKADAEKAKTDAQKKREELDSKIEQKKREVSKAESKVGWEQGASTEVKIKKRQLAELEAQRDAQVKAEEAATTKSKEADVTLAEEKKTRDQAKATQAAEEKKAKEAKVSSSMEQSQRARNNDRPKVIEAPPAPGTPEARDAELSRIRKDKEAAKNKPVVTNAQTPINQPVSQNAVSEYAQTTAATYGSTKPRTQVLSSTQTPVVPTKESKNPQSEQYLSGKKARRQAYLSRFRPEVREKMMTKEEKAERDSQAAKAEEAKKKAETQAQEQQASSFREEAAGHPRLSELQQQTETFNTNQGIIANSLRAGLPENNAFHSGASQPVPSNLPKPVEYNRRVKDVENSTNTPSAKAKETTAQIITLDQTSLDGLNTFNTNFGAYVDKLVNFQFPTIPEKIEMTGTHTVDVRVSGAAAFESIQKGMKDLINKSIDEKMNEIWRQTGGAIGTRPGTPPNKGK